MFDRRGTILKHVRIGHAQTASVGKYRPDLPGLQLMCVNFWRNPGIVTLFDADGNILAQEEPIHSGSPMLPVNWRGDGQEFVLLSGKSAKGGMIDGQIRRVVMFPDDGHPDLAAYVANLTGDARDEMILWDQERVLDLHPGPALLGRTDVCADAQSRLQRVELPHRRLAAGVGIFQELRSSGYRFGGVGRMKTVDRRPKVAPMRRTDVRPFPSPEIHLRRARFRVGRNDPIGRLDP